MNEQKPQQESLGKSTLTILSIGTLLVFLALVGGVYWWVSKKSKGQVVFPAGINYTGNETPAPTQQPQRGPLRHTPYPAQTLSCQLR